jgi:hypothetical protein
MQESISVVDSIATESKVQDAYFSTCSGVLQMGKFLYFERCTEGGDQDPEIPKIPENTEVQ